jgi:hypothetical protein
VYCLASIQKGVGEALITWERANLFRGIEAVGGLIILTDKRIIFQPHLFNIQRSVVEIPLKDVVEVRERNTYEIVPNGMLVKTRSGEEYKFVVPDRKSIIDLIKRNIGTIKTT